MQNAGAQDDSKQRYNEKYKTMFTWINTLDVFI